jgi:hypothetical protein
MDADVASHIGPPLCRLRGRILSNHLILRHRRPIHHRGERAASTGSEIDVVKRADAPRERPVPFAFQSRCTMREAKPRSLKSRGIDKLYVDRAVQVLTIKPPGDAP